MSAMLMLITLLAPLRLFSFSIFTPFCCYTPYAATPIAAYADASFIARYYACRHMPLDGVMPRYAILRDDADAMPMPFRALRYVA